MKLGFLPDHGTYPVGQCIYCGSGASLAKEHVIPRSLGGQVILEKASCQNCANEIKTYEAWCLQNTFMQARTFLRLPMYKPAFRVKTLRLGIFPDMGVIFPSVFQRRWTDVPLDDHPAAVVLPIFGLPGILRDVSAPASRFESRGVSRHFFNGSPPLPSDGNRYMNLVPFVPDKLGRFIAKIAHGAAWATLGEAFVPLLTDVIRNKAEHLSYFVGSPHRIAWRRRPNLHHITLSLSQGYVIATVQLFARYGLTPYLAVVGIAKDEPLYCHWQTQVTPALWR